MERIKSFLIHPIDISFLVSVVYRSLFYACFHFDFFLSIFIFRYGREDEEVMGLKFCNEAIIALKQIWPISNEKETLTPLQVCWILIFHNILINSFFHYNHWKYVVIFGLNKWQKINKRIFAVHFNWYYTFRAFQLLFKQKREQY